VSNSETAVSAFTVKVDDSTEILRSFVFPNKQLNPENRRKLEAFMASKQIRTDVSSFMRLERFAADRAEAVTALKLKER